MACKQQYKEINTLESVSEPVLSTCVDGVITDLSVVKKGKSSSYFHGSVSDGKTKLQIVRFTKGQYKAIKEFLMKKIPVHLEDRQINSGRRWTKMEIKLKDSTKPPNTFNYSAIDFDTDAGIAINLGDMRLYQKGIQLMSLLLTFANWSSKVATP
jgi:hypothetical protein